MSKYYPDISHHHPVGDWGKIEKNCPFIISKATQGTTFVDPSLDSFISNCEKRKIPYWLYTFLINGDGEKQAKYLVDQCKKKVGKHFIGYIVDAEKDPSTSKSPTDDQVRAALDYLSKTGYKWGLYTGFTDYSRYRHSIIKAKNATNGFLWEARYGLNNGGFNNKYPCHSGVDLHQFTSSGTCPGIRDKIDLNRLTGEKEESWFITPFDSKTGYPGVWPALPPRGYYQIGDGYKTLKDYKTQIKRVQKLLNWITGSDLKTDGFYGQDTANAQEKAQKILSLTINGKFGNQTLKKAKSLKK